MNEIKVMFVGNVLLDFTIRCDQKLIEKYGFEIDKNYEANDDQLVLFDELWSTPGVEVTPGENKNELLFLFNFSL